MKCIHYCAVGGHTWTHDVQSIVINKATLPDCEHRSTTTEMIRFFQPCTEHQKTLQNFRRFTGEDY